MQVRIELTEEENDKVKKAADSVRMTKKDYMRQAVLSGEFYMLDLQNAEPFLNEASDLIQEMKKYARELRQNGDESKADEVIKKADELKTSVRRVVFKKRKIEK